MKKSGYSPSGVKKKLVEELEERMGKGLIVSPADLALRREAHKRECVHCSKPQPVACPGLVHIEQQLQRAIEQARWKPPIKQPLSSMPVSWTDPECLRLNRHGELGTYDQCPHCEVYSIQKRAEYEAQREASKPGAGSGDQTA